MKYCLYCGSIYSESFRDYEDETCMDEGFTLTEDPDMTEEKFNQLSEEEKDAYELHILDLCRQSGFFHEKECIREKDPIGWYLTFRFDKYEQLTGRKAKTKENELYYDMKAQESVDRCMALYSPTIKDTPKNIPKCPTCQSTNIRKISTASKVVNTALFGLFGSKRHKTFHCDNCGYEW